MNSTSTVSKHLLSHFRWLILGGAFLLLAACSGGGGSSSSGGGAWLIWNNSGNGTIVLDANGNQYEFQATNGCMYLRNGNVGPANFCLTTDASSQTGYANYGATNCSSPSSNSNCNTASFDVVLTTNPSGSGCIAVLGNGGATSVVVYPLSVTSGSVNQPGFSIQQVTSASSFTLYWNGIIPICGGNNPYVGNYLFEGGSFIGNNAIVTVDSGGVIDYNGGVDDQASGSINSNGSGGFTSYGAFPAQQWFTCTINNAAKNANGLWVISGGCTNNVAGGSTGFTMTEQ